MNVCSGYGPTVAWDWYEKATVVRRAIVDEVGGYDVGHEVGWHRENSSIAPIYVHTLDPQDHHRTGE